MKDSVLIIDNYDSFVFNIVQYLKRLGYGFEIFKNDEIDFARLSEFKRIIISPGPGIPSEAGDLLKLIGEVKQSHSVLGVCLGHQAIAEYFGATLRRVAPKHGYVSSLITVNGGDAIYDGVADFRIGRYHSWEIDSVPDSLIITGTSEGGDIMSLRHKIYNVRSVQFHPESIMTPCGLLMLKNWLEKCDVC